MRCTSNECFCSWPPVRKVTSTNQYYSMREETLKPVDVLTGVVRVFHYTYSEKP